MGGSCSSSCDRGKKKSTPSPKTRLRLEFDNKSNQSSTIQKFHVSMPFSLSEKRYLGSQIGYVIISYKDKMINEVFTTLIAKLSKAQL